MGESLSEAIQAVRNECECDCSACLAGAVAAHIAGVLDAERATWSPDQYELDKGACYAISSVRVALLGTTEATEATDV